MKRKPVPFKSSQQLLGKAIRDSDGLVVGHVLELLLDVTDGRIAYVGIALAESEDGARRRATIPWSAVNIVDNGDSWCVGARKHTLARIAEAYEDGA